MGRTVLTGTQVVAVVDASSPAPAEVAAAAPRQTNMGVAAPAGVAVLPNTSLLPVALGDLETALAATHLGAAEEVAVRLLTVAVVDGARLVAVELTLLEVAAAKRLHSTGALSHGLAATHRGFTEQYREFHSI